MRILIYNWRDLEHRLAGGAEVYTAAIAREWVKSGHAVTLFCSTVAAAPSEEIHEDGYTIIRRGSRHSVYREAKKYWKNEGSGNFDLVLDEINTRPFSAPKFVRNCPVMALAHQVADEVWQYEVKWPLSWFGRFVLEPYWLRQYKDIATITLSESSKESLQRYGLGRVSVVAVGFDDDNCHTAPVAKERSLTMVFVGRLSANKRPGHALEALAHVRQEVPDAELWVVGDGPLRGVLESAARPGVKLFGRVKEDEKRQLMARAHFLLATSVREGWGLVVSEAARVGTMSVGYDVAGLRDSIIAANGKVVSESPEMLARAVVDAFREGDWQRSVSCGGTVPWRDVAVEMIGVFDSEVSCGPIKTISDV